LILKAYVRVHGKSMCSVLEKEEVASWYMDVIKGIHDDVCEMD